MSLFILLAAICFFLALVLPSPTNPRYNLTTFGLFFLSLGLLFGNVRLPL